MKGGSNRLMSTRETAERLSVSVKTLYRRWREWGLPAYEVGGLKFRERDVENWIERRVA
jgi:excisionase family DNA binding protein